MRRFHSHYRTEKEEPEPILSHQTCPVCQTLNDNRQDWCSSCGTPLNTAGALQTAQKRGLLNPKDNGADLAEIEQLKAELTASREREQNFMKEQLQLLQQMQEIRSAMAGNLNHRG